jgi:hypothetical protein
MKLIIRLNPEVYDSFLFVNLFLHYFPRTYFYTMTTDAITTNNYLNNELILYVLLYNISQFGGLN